MWLCDLMTAAQAVKEKKGHDLLLFTKVEPCWDGGVLFTTTNNTYIKWFPNGEIVERRKDEWRRK